MAINGSKPINQPVPKRQTTTRDTIADPGSSQLPKQKIDGRLERGQRRRAALLDAARELFLQQGYRATTLEAIIARAGGSRETIYQYFGDKRGLFGAIVSGVGERLAASISEPSALQLPPREGLTRLALHQMAIWSSDEVHAVHQIVFSEGMNSPEILEAWYRGGMALSMRALTKYLTLQRDAGHLILDDPAQAARQFLLLLAGEAAFQAVTGGGDPSGPDDTVNMTVELFLKAYLPS